MKRWVQEKQQREKNLITTRRYRHKSLGDVESISKSKRQQQLFSQTVQVKKHFILTRYTYIYMYTDLYSIYIDIFFYVTLTE